MQFFSAVLEHSEELLCEEDSFHHHTGSLAVQNERNVKRVLEAIRKRPSDLLQPAATWPDTEEKRLNLVW